MHVVYKLGEEPNEYNFEEYCPHCDSAIPVVIDNDEMDRYDIVCPVCGNELMLCTLCMWDQEETGEDAPGYCDFHDGKCFRRK